MSSLRFCFLALAVLACAAAPASVAAQDAAKQAPDSVVFTTGMGTVLFLHGKHAAADDCAACHHESRPEKPLSDPHESCGNCHTEPATPPVTTSLKTAIHDTRSGEGVCLTCHNKAAENGTVVPERCGDCHKREEGSS